MGQLTCCTCFDKNAKDRHEVNTNQIPVMSLSPINIQDGGGNPDLIKPVYRGECDDLTITFDRDSTADNHHL